MGSLVQRGYQLGTSTNYLRGYTRTVFNDCLRVDVQFLYDRKAPGDPNPKAYYKLIIGAAVSSGSGRVVAIRLAFTNVIVKITVSRDEKRAWSSMVCTRYSSNWIVLPWPSWHLWDRWSLKQLTVKTMVP